MWGRVLTGVMLAAMAGCGGAAGTVAGDGEAAMMAGAGTGTQAGSPSAAGLSCTMAGAKVPGVADPAAACAAVLEGFTAAGGQPARMAGATAAIEVLRDTRVTARVRLADGTELELGETRMDRPVARETLVALGAGLAGALSGATQRRP